MLTHCAGTASEGGGQLRGESIFFPLQNKALDVLQELHRLFPGSFTKLS